MKRRGILIAGGAAAAGVAAAVGWPGWLRGAFVEGHATTSGPGPSGSSPDEGAPCPAGIRKDPSAHEAKSATRKQSAAEILEEARTRAVAEKKKILVLVIPEGDDWGPSYERGHAFGEFLNHGASADLAPLASALVVCARMGDVRSAFGSAPGGQPLMVLVDPSSRPAGLRALDATLPSLPGGRGRTDDTKEAENRVINDRIALVARLVHQGLGEAPGGEVEERAGIVRQTIVKQRPPGGQWASSSGCGVDYEEGPVDNSGGVDCGMGHVPERSSRFLYFLVNKAG